MQQPNHNKQDNNCIGGKNNKLVMFFDGHMQTPPHNDKFHGGRIICYYYDCVFVFRSPKCDYDEEVFDVYY